MLLRDLALPPGSSSGLVRVLADVHTTADVVTASQRALALALCTPTARGVLVRDSAVWVWTGAAAFTPCRVDLASPPSSPALPGPRPGRGRAALPVRAVRWVRTQTWTTLRGVALTDPVSTAVAAARLLPPDQAHRRLEALQHGPGWDVAEALRRLPGAEGSPGCAQAGLLLRRAAPAVAAG